MDRKFLGQPGRNWCANPLTSSLLDLDEGRDLTENSESVARRLERELNRIRGVRQAKVATAEGRNASVTILVLPEVGTDEVIHAVRAAGRRIGIDVDPAIVRVLRSSDEPDEDARHERRRRLASLQTKRAGGRFMAWISLELEGDVLLGEVDGPSGRLYERRSMAEAVVDGLRGLLDVSVQVDAVDVVPLGDDEVALVSLSAGALKLVGCAPVRIDEYDAIARAALGALNRFLTGPIHVDRRAISGRGLA